MFLPYRTLPLPHRTLDNGSESESHGILKLLNTGAHPGFAPPPNLGSARCTK